MTSASPRRTKTRACSSKKNLTQSPTSPTKGTCSSNSSSLMATKFRSSRRRAAAASEAKTKERLFGQTITSSRTTRSHKSSSLSSNRSITPILTITTCESVTLYELTNLRHPLQRPHSTLQKRELETIMRKLNNIKSVCRQKLHRLLSSN